MNTADWLYALLRAAISGGELEAEANNTLADQSLSALYALAKAHDLAPMVSAVLVEHGLIGDGKTAERFQQQQWSAVYRCEQMQYELEQISHVLETAQIPHIPLKGAVLRGWYPTVWFRTSCDIDVLVHREDLEKASDCLVNALNYRTYYKSSHDLSLSTPSGVHVELHYDLIEDGSVRASSEVLARVWEYAVPAAGCTYRMDMQDDMFYAYHIAHMAKHFELGGCGIRPFLDLWVLEHRVDHDAKRRNALLRESGLLPFADACRKLSEVWFSGAVPNELTKRMQAYVLNGGIYGTRENRVLVQQNKQGGKLRYALTRIFLPYEQLQYLFPIIQKHRWLTPMMEVFRWCKLIFNGKFKRSIKELSFNQRITAEQAESVCVLLREIGL